DHGGDLERAMARYGGERAAWIDLSTGINPVPYPVPSVSAEAWATLPSATALEALTEAARQAYGLADTTACAALSGAQAIIQKLPEIAPQGPVCVVEPTYNEHARVFRNVGVEVQALPDLEALPAGIGTLCLVSPNNPDGRKYTPQVLRELAARVRLLVVDESFIDPTPEESLLAAPLPSSVLVLRSFGKFFGLAGLRLGFACGAPELISRLSTLAGPWAVSGPALEIGTAALNDRAWATETRKRLTQDSQRLDDVALSAGATLVGGTPLFRTYRVEDAAATQHHLAQNKIWSRIFPYSAHWLRLGLPGSHEDWQRVERAVRTLKG
ncbi:MAG: threonine-phosphate decarboxylase CobD, partial [Pseudomonadota bacterium]